MSRNRTEGIQTAKSAREIFTAALACADEAARARLLESECNRNADLKAKVEALLEASTRTGDFLERPAVKDQTRGAGWEDWRELPGERPGDQIGPYRLVELVGEGGGGSVYRAEQQDPVRRTVALKILKLGMDSRSGIKRFSRRTPPS